MSPSPTTPNTVTREQLEAKFREVTGGVQEGIEDTRSQALAVGLAVAFAVIGLVYVIGRRSGNKKSAVVEVRRV